MAYKSKFKGKEIDDRLDLVQELSDDISDIKEDIKNTIQEETDPVFSNSPAASITEEKKAEWDNKVDKVNGKQLSTEDFTTILKTKLEGLSNYDDTELSEALSTLRGDFDKLVSGDTTTAIKTFNEIIAFLDGIQDSQDLSSIIASIEHQITAKQDRITDLDAIRRGAEKGATALQSSDIDNEILETSTNPVQNKVIAGVLTEIVGMLDTALSSVGERFDSKQDNLVSGENIKTINGESILGSGNISIEGVDNVYIADFTLRNMTATADTTIDFASLRNAMREGKVILVSSGLDSYMVATTRYIPGVGRNPNKIYISVTDGIIIYNSTAISNPASIKSSENFKSTIATTDYVDNKGSNVYVMDIKLNALSNDQDVTFDYTSLESAINEGKIILIEDDLSPKMMFVVNASLQGDSIIMKVSNTLSYIWATAYSNGDGTGIIQANTKIYKSYATEEYVNNAVEDVNVKGDDGYVYSNGEKVDMRFTRSLIPVGTSIPAKANLNTVEYLKVGKYYCSLNADAKTITNCPTANAFMMEVFNPLSTVVDNEVDSTYVYRIRILTEYSTGIQYVQYCTVGSTVNKWTYDSWYVCPRTKFTLNSNKNDGSAALGSASQGVYINSEGTFVKMNYTIAKSVPSSAVFTDTKVTAVGNHYTPVEDESVVIEAPDGEVVIGLKRDAAGHVVDVISTPMSSGGSSEYESNIEDKTLAMPNAVGGIAKGTTISALEGKTYNEMFDDLLFPTVNPTFTAPSASIAFKNYSSTQEVGATGPTSSNFTTGYSAGEIKLNGVKQANRGGAHDTANSFIYVNGSTSNKTLPAKVTLGSTTFKYRAAFAEGPQPKNNKGGDYSTPLAAGTVDSSAITLNGTYPWYASTSSATSTNPVVKQSLVAWNTTAGNMSTGQFTVQPSGTLPQVFKLPRKLHTLQLKNALNGQMETVSDVSKDYTESTETINIGGTDVTYYVYTYKGSTRGSVTLLAKF